MKAALQVFTRRIKSCIAKKKLALDIFLDTVGAFDNFPSITTAVRGLMLL